MYPALLKNIIYKFKSINFVHDKLNNIKEFIVYLYYKKTIENLNFSASLLNSEHKDIVLEIIDKSILLHAPFLKNKSNMDIILEGWIEYFKMYLNLAYDDIPEFLV